MSKLESLFGKAKKIVEKASGKEKREKLITQIYQEYIYGLLEQRELLRLLKKEDVESFIQYHKLEREKILAGSDRKLIFKINQLDNLIEKWLEESVAKAHGENIIRKWN